MSQSNPVQGDAQLPPSAFIPTHDQLAEIHKVNLAVNNDPKWVGDSNFCVPAMAQKMVKLQAAGIPFSAMMPVTVDAGKRYGDQAHSILQIKGANPDGSPRSTFLDINQPFPLSSRDVSDLGYTILE